MLSDTKQALCQPLSFMLPHKHHLRNYHIFKHFQTLVSRWTWCCLNIGMMFSDVHLFSDRKPTFNLYSLTQNGPYVWSRPHPKTYWASHEELIFSLEASVDHSGCLQWALLQLLVSILHKLLNSFNIIPAACDQPRQALLLIINST